MEISEEAAEAWRKEVEGYWDPVPILHQIFKALTFMITREHKYDESEDEKMTDELLGTLKDLPSRVALMPPCSSHNTEVVAVEDLKDEAILWVKDLRASLKKDDELHSGICFNLPDVGLLRTRGELRGAIRVIMCRNNLTEEDLETEPDMSEYYPDDVGTTPLG